MAVYQTKGIILHRFMHSDNKMIVKVYTESFGMVSYLCFCSSSKKKDKNRFIPMSLVEITGHKKNGSHFDYFDEMNVLTGLYAGTFDIAKSSVSMFFNEVLYQLLYDAPEDKTLFNFLFENLFRFFREELSPDFHLRFLVALIRELGFSPEDNYSSSSRCFNLEKSCFEHTLFSDKDDPTLGTYMHHLLNEELFPKDNQCIIPYLWRNKLLDLILQYYRFHINHFSPIKSHEILKTVLHG
ncbi:MAG: DNA repair protein RecO [Bacteroidales bacterium]|jgi:DNA repair protein RecO (recombination protein O)|nr:DNA repair protein RecO [Bacteroidales bacterium]